MKNTLRIFVLLLALLMILPAVVACGDTGDKETPTGNNDQGTKAPTENGTKDPGADGTEDGTNEVVGGHQSSLDTQNWGGVELTIVGRSAEFKAFDQFEVYSEEYDPADMVGSAVYTRNQIMEDKHGFIIYENKQKDVRSYASSLLAAQDASVGDLLIFIPDTVQALASMGYFVDMAKLEHIHLENDCWHHTTTKEITFGGKLFYNTSKFLLQDKLRTYFLIYNRDFAMKLEYDHYAFENDVVNNTWTLERFSEIKKKATYELDGEDGASAADAWGLCGDGNNSFAVFCFGAGLQQSVIGEDGYPVMIGATEHMADIVDTCERIVLGTGAKEWYIEGGAIPKTDNLVSASQVHLNGNAMFHSTFPSVFDTAYNVGVPFEYGFLPFPKFDSSQETYISTPNYGNGSIFAIPYTVADAEMMGYFVQAISEEAVDTSYTSFIEEKCKLDNGYDQWCADMLDIVFNSIRYDIAAMCNYGSCYTVVNSTIPALTDIASYALHYPPVLTAANAELEKIKAAYDSFS